MTAPQRIQLRRTKGWKMPPNTVKVTRPGKWGNPWKPGMRRCHTPGGGLYMEEPVKGNEEAVKFFREMLAFADRNYPSNAEIVAELRGKNLACYCPLNQPCHADVLLELANSEDVP